jgi:hypothetical protein
MAAQQVTSRGCSRSYILCVCYRALYFVSVEYEQCRNTSFPFNEDEVKLWLTLAQTDCLDEDFQNKFGGTRIDLSDSSTFWV